MEVAEAAVLEKGFGGTSIEELIAAVGITKGGFFYHFHDKSELAKALLQRYVENENRLFDELFSRADERQQDPLHGFLAGLERLSALLGDLPSGHPGCIVAAICYQEQLFNREVADLSAGAVLAWRVRFRRHFARIAETYPPKIAVDFDDLADMLSGLADGGIILSKVLKDRQALPRQILLYRDFVRAVFLGTGH